MRGTRSCWMKFEPGVKSPTTCVNGWLPRLMLLCRHLRRAQEALLSARPYHEALKRVADSLLLSAPEVIARAENAARKMLIVVVASDRGLAGGYNVNLLRLAEQERLRRHGGGLAAEFF